MSKSQREGRRQRETKRKRWTGHQKFSCRNKVCLLVTHSLHIPILTVFSTFLNPPDTYLPIKQNQEKLSPRWPLLDYGWCALKEKNHTTAPIVTIRNSSVPSTAKSLMRHDDSLTSLGHLLFLTPQTLPFSFIFCATYKPLILRRKCLSSSRNLKPYKLLSHISSCICTHSYLQSERMWCPFFYARSSPSSLPGSLPSKPCSRKKEEKK